MSINLNSYGIQIINLSLIYIGDLFIIVFTHLIASWSVFVSVNLNGLPLWYNYQSESDLYR